MFGKSASTLWLSAAVCLAVPATANAESLRQALAWAYSNNPTINAQRANTRSVDENIALAKTGYRPQISASADIGSQWTRTRSPLGTTNTHLNPGGFGVTVSQTLFDGFQTANNVRAAKAGVMASRESLRNIEQNVLFDAASAYMDVIQNAAIVKYRSKALEFLNEQVRAERSRFQVGESTRTDVAQAEAAQAGARAELSAAKGTLTSSRAVYRQLIGKEPGRLKSPALPNRLLPNSSSASFSYASSKHPAILATRHLVDQALFNVKSAEGSLLPQLSLNGSVSRRTDVSPNTDTDSASITATLSVPIYQGGSVSATVRQNKEILGQRRIEVDQAVANVRAAVVSAYSQLSSAKSAISANEAQLKAANLALSGAIEERRVGQRTTLDVLNTQQGVINAQIDLARSRRNLVVSAYAAISASGKLTAKHLKLGVAVYDPQDHYIAVKDKWYGLRTPDGQ